MKKWLCLLVISAPLVVLSGCGFQTVYYEPSYGTDYVYSVGYYNTRPCNTNYYVGYGVGNYGYWGSPSSCNSSYAGY